MTLLKTEEFSSVKTAAMTSSQRALRSSLRLRTAGDKVRRKYRKQLWRRECRNLKAIVPSVANKNVSDVEVIEEAVGYIEQLHRAIAERLGIMPCDQMINALHHMAKLRNAAHAQAKLPPSMQPTNQICRNNSYLNSNVYHKSQPVLQQPIYRHNGLHTSGQVMEKVFTPVRL